MTLRREREVALENGFAVLPRHSHREFSVTRYDALAGHLAQAEQRLLNDIVHCVSLNTNIIDTRMRAGCAFNEEASHFTLQ